MSDKIRLEQVRPGRRIEYRGSLRSEKRSITIDREWNVFWNDEYIGAVRYAMVTRERRFGRNTYVHSRWQSPGWLYQPLDSFRWIESAYRSKKGCIESLIHHCMRVRKGAERDAQDED